MTSQVPMDQRRTIRIPVDAVLHYRTPEMDKFETCRVFSVSTMSLEILLPQALALNTKIYIAARAEGLSKQHYRLLGNVLRVQKCRWETGLLYSEEGEWLHIITAPDGESWPTMFVYDVVCTDFDPALKDYPVLNEYADVIEMMESTRGSESKSSRTTKSGPNTSLKPN